MNLHAIVSPVIGVVNPQLEGIIKISTGYVTDPLSGKRIPSYATPKKITMQIQALSSKDLQHVSGLNINGEMRVAYITGELESTVRPENKGGDLVYLKNGTIWLTVYSLENWNLTSGWMKAVITRQNNS